MSSIITGHEFPDKLLALGNGVLASDMRQCAVLRQRHGIVSLKVFGSVARGEGAHRSDVDLLVEFAPERAITLLGYIAIEREFSELLGCRVDLVEPSALKPNIGRRILEQAVPI